MGIYLHLGEKLKTSINRILTQTWENNGDGVLI